MDATTIFVIGLIAAAVIVGAGIFTIAARRGPSAGPITGSFDREAEARDVAARRARDTAALASGGVGTLVREETGVEVEDEAPVVAEPLPDPLLDRVDISKEDFDVTRRQFLNRALLGLFAGGFLGGLTISFLAFMWPKLKGGFGTPIDVGSAIDLRNRIAQGDGSLSPVFVAAAQTWITAIDEAVVPGSSFEDLPVVAGGGAELGLMALWQRCVHLGCRVPSCDASQGFECPCHGSRYNFHGEYEAGPAPRNLDRFAVEVNDAGRLIVDTGAVVETPRAKTKTIAYPQGPSCI